MKAKSLEMDSSHWRNGDKGEGVPEEVGHRIKGQMGISEPTSASGVNGSWMVAGTREEAKHYLESSAERPDSEG